MAIEIGGMSVASGGGSGSGPSATSRRPATIAGWALPPGTYDLVVFARGGEDRHVRHRSHRPRHQDAVTVRFPRYSR
jgi:hypothetical protein